jgi:lysophospholipase L1-like esterase
MNTFAQQPPPWLTAVLALIAILPHGSAQAAAGEPSFAGFDRRARVGEQLNVVFFGASLTWGANATDPQLTSYRALVGRHLEEHYPKAHFRFWDAAIGGTGSQLGVFRLDRDVLRRKPDLVFLDFSANDDIGSADPETLASYEAILRRIIAEAKCPVVQVIFPFKWNVEHGKLEEMKRRTAHLKLSRTYGTGVSDGIAFCQAQVAAGVTTVAKIWPVDGAHPCDAGYALFATVVWDEFQQAIREKRVCRAPAKMVYPDTYMHSARVRLSSLAPLPPGWTVKSPHLTSAWFDALMSRWLDDVTIATRKDNAAPLRLKFRGSMVMLFGEATPKTGRFRIELDGQPAARPSSKADDADRFEFNPGRIAKLCKGNTHLTELIAAGLDPQVEHTLILTPIWQDAEDEELRIESVCVAGGEATVDIQPNTNQ